MAPASSGTPWNAGRAFAPGPVHSHTVPALRVACLLVVAAGLAGLLSAAPPVDDVQERPNVLLVSIDSLRADHLGSYGYERDTSPTIDRLAREGVLFENAISPASWTVPAHMTLLTALPPEVHQVSSHRRALHPAAVTLAEVLRDAGYRTAGFVSGPTVMSNYGFGQGFELYDETVAAMHRNPNRGITSPAIVERVAAYLDEWDASGRGAPFFAFVHLWDVHYDYAPPAPYDRMFDPDYTGDLTSEDFERNERLHAGMPERDLQHLIALYDGEIRFTDEHLGRIVEHLERLGVLDHTIVVVTSDHGDEFFEHGQKGHSKTLYDEIVRVPLVIRYPPRVTFGRRITEQVRLMDVAPTILGLAGIEGRRALGLWMPMPYQALDLTPWIAGRRLYAPLPELLAFSESTAFLGVKRSVRTNQAKLIRHHQRPERTELFDLARDPGERTNLFGSAQARPLRRELDASFTRWTKLWRPQPKLAVARRPSPQHEARLRALGYIR